jgi:hypothetical protein
MLVGSTTAEVSAYAPADLIGGRVGIGPEKSLHRHDLSGSTVTALEGILFKESLLYRTKLLSFHQPLDRRNFFSFGLHSQGHTRIARLSIDENRAGAALPALATDLGSGQSQFFPEDEKERPTGLNEQAMPSAIDEESDLGQFDGFQDFGRRLSTEFLRRSSRHSPCSHELKKSTTGYSLKIFLITLPGHTLLPVSFIFLPISHARRQPTNHENTLPLFPLPPDGRE